MPFGFLGDIPAATAILDCSLAYVTIVQMTGKGYRYASARRQLMPEAVDGAAAVGAENAPTAAWKTQRTRFPSSAERLWRLSWFSATI